MIEPGWLVLTIVVVVVLFSFWAIRQSDAEVAKLIEFLNRKEKG